MKRYRTVLVMFFAIVFLAGSSVWAKSAGQGGSKATVSSEQREQFLKDTEPLRKSLCDKQVELRTLLANPQSDPATVGALQKEIYQIREQIREKAVQAGFGCPYGGMGAGGMGRGPCGMGMGYGRPW